MNNALYLRLSIADGDLGRDGKDESNSIENQRLLLERHIETHEELKGEIFEYVDDGYSGTNFDRPAFRRMIEDAKKGRIETILVKDFSRLGRDYITVGDYLEQIFPILKVRFIAVNNNYDSRHYKGTTLGLDMTASNLVNTLYSRDLSRKVKSAIMSKWKQGWTTNGNPPFGYIKDYSARGTWAIDPDAAKLVREVFDRALEGYSTRMITEYMNEKGYPTPNMHRKKQGRATCNVRTPDNEILWNTAIVLAILKRYEYTGAFVHNKRTKTRPTSKSTRRVPESEWIITDDKHDAIITKEEYYKAQGVIRKQRKHRFTEPINFGLKGKIKCGNCHLALAYQVNLYEPVFYCMHAMKTGSASSCCTDQYVERSVEDAVFAALCQQMKLFMALHSKMLEEQNNNPVDVGRKIRNLRRRIDVKCTERIRGYEAFADGHIRKDEYMKKKGTLTEEIKKLEDEMDQLTKSSQEEVAFIDDMTSLGDLARIIKGKDKLTQEMIDNFIDMVYVYDAKHIEVKYKFSDLLQKAIEKYETADQKDEVGA